jgi:tetratricopeptide (TPR) repeat protein
MERSLLEAWRTRAAVAVSPDRSRRRAPALAVMAMSAAAATLLGAAAGLYVSTNGPVANAAVGEAQFELRIGDAAMQRGTVTTGQELQSGESGHIEVAVGDSRLEFGRRTHVRFDRISDDDVALTLLRGRLDVRFHPRRPGEQRMAVSTRAARVRVVGTEFVVGVDGVGNTTVAVSEGVVEVVPRAGGEIERVAAGETVLMPMDTGDQYERSLRASIEAEIAALELPAEDEPNEDEAGEVEAGEVEALDMDFGDQPSGFDEGVIDSERAAALRRLRVARRLLRQGQHERARAMLSRVVKKGAARIRVEALTLIAESHAVQAHLDEARAAYERAFKTAPGHPAAHNALFAQARLIERHVGDKAAASEAYQRYLERAPTGPLAGQAREALCRLDGNCE